MKRRALGRTGLEVSIVGYGAGPVAGLMDDPGAAERQLATVTKALAAGINWFDTAPGYGDGASERALGAALRELDAAARVHVASKVRLRPEDLSDVAGAVRRSVEASLTRLGLERLALLQLHNAIASRRDALPSALAIADVVGPRSFFAAAAALQTEGLVRQIGLCGLGEGAVLRAAIEAAPWDAIQFPRSLVARNSTLLELCSSRGIGAIAIRVLAGGALAGRAPSRHTLKTPYFPLAVFRADETRAAALAQILPPGLALSAAALRYVIGDPRIATALIGFGSPKEVDAAAAAASAGPLSPELLQRIEETSAG